MKYVLCNYDDSLPLKKLKKTLIVEPWLLVNYDLSLTGFYTEALSTKEEEDILKEIPTASISESLPEDWKPFSMHWNPISDAPKTEWGLGEITENEVAGLRNFLTDWVAKTGTKASLGGCQARLAGNPNAVDKLLILLSSRTKKDNSGVFVLYENSIPVGVVSGSILSDGYVTFFSPDITCYAVEGRNDIMRVWHRYVRPFCEARGVTIRRSWVPKYFSDEVTFCTHGTGFMWSNIDWPEKPGNLGQNLVSATEEPDDAKFKAILAANDLVKNKL
jgi:hypothetical protein